MPNTVFDDIRVIEITGLIAQQCGKQLADMGADVIRIEPPGGSEARRIGPFLEDEPNPDRSLSFWHYNTNKRSVTLDIRTPSGAALLKRLVREADVVLEDLPPGALPALGLGYHELKAEKSDLIMVSLTPFGQTGPYRDLKSSDLVSLALGGPLWSCGYDDHEIPPTRPYTDASYHIGSHFAFLGTVAALVQRQMTGEGQYIDVSVHEACHDTTEGAMPTYYGGRGNVQRQTGRHAAAVQTQAVLFTCGDGREIFTRIPVEPNAWEQFIEWLDEAGMAGNLKGEEFRNPPARRNQYGHISDIVAAFCLQHTAEELFLGAQKRGMVWAPVHSPDETVHDEHLRERGFFVQVEHPELGRSFEYAGAPYKFHGTPWSIRRRAPLLAEDNQDVFGGLLGLNHLELTALREARVI